MAHGVKAAIILAVALVVGRSSLPVAVLLMADGIAHHVWITSRAPAEGTA